MLALLAPARAAAGPAAHAPGRGRLLVLPILLLAALLLGLPLPAVASPSALAPAAPSAPAAPAAPAGPLAPAAPPEVNGVSLDLLDAGAVALTPGSALTLVVRLTNAGDAPMTDPRIELRARTDRVTDRGALASWSAATAPDERGEPAAVATAGGTLAPGASVTLTVSATPEQLGFPAVDYLWGVRRISVTAAEGTAPLASLRTFTVWRPDGSDGVDSLVRTSVLLPVAAADPGSVVADPEAFADSEAHGRLAALRVLSERPDVDWLLDPALLDPPSLAVDAAAQAPGAAPADPADPAAGAASDGGGAPSPSADAGLGVAPEYAEPPAAAELAAQLALSGQGRTVLGMPFARADVTAMRAAGTTTLMTALQERADRAWARSGITPAGTAVVVPSTQASTTALAEGADSGADVLVLPSASLGDEEAGTVTPSAIATTGRETPVPVLVPDSQLSTRASALRSGEDVEKIRQEILAETAVISSQQVTASRQVLLMPEIVPDSDSAAIGALLDSFGQAPWLQPAPVADLLDAAGTERLTTDTEADPSLLYGRGRIDAGAVRPVAVQSDGSVVPLAQPDLDAHASPELLRRLQGSLGELDTLGSVMDDPQQLDGPHDLLLTTSSIALATDTATAQSRADAAAAQFEAMRGAITVVPASGYNLVSDSAGVPITVSNQLDTAITVQVRVKADRPIVDIGEPPLVQVPARGQSEIVVPISALANGTVTLTTVLQSSSGEQITAPVEVPLSVNPAWENWATMALVLAMAALMGIGVVRARRNGSAKRAPAERGPEPPPEELELLGSPQHSDPRTPEDPTR
ncbi:DUF6049 family protein [Brachybacterium sp. JHP9]|uniref:DUF6049 family protein n=1 Tax=Brachybacterium equifaecis TaxID=2910770 RepID=A0ABT0R245_9MICO|nr:DUF6049 family protein [Brachybacterium equifaecis]MCL6424006.1 DUF6049 family protein [Brachybacterium equifaecis]